MEEKEQQIIRDILAILAYEGDPEAFIKDFFTSSKYEAMTTLLQTLPKDRLEHLEQRLLQGVKDASAKATVLEYVSKEVYEASLKQTIAKNLQEFIAVALRELRDRPAEKERLLAYVTAHALPLPTSV